MEEKDQNIKINMSNFLLSASAGSIKEERAGWSALTLTQRPLTISNQQERDEPFISAKQRSHICRALSLNMDAERSILSRLLAGYLS